VDDGGSRTTGQPEEGRPAGGPGRVPASAAERPTAGPAVAAPSGWWTPSPWPAAAHHPAGPTHQLPGGPPRRSARPPGTEPARQGRPPTGRPGPPLGPALAPPRRVDALLDSATRPLRALLPRVSDLPTRRFPRAIDPQVDERPTTVIPPVDDAPGSDAPAPPKLPPAAATPGGAQPGHPAAGQPRPADTDPADTDPADTDPADTASDDDTALDDPADTALDDTALDDTPLDDTEPWDAEPWEAGSGDPDSEYADPGTPAPGAPAPRNGRTDDAAHRTAGPADPASPDAEPAEPAAPAQRRHDPRTFGRALLATAASTVLPGSGHLMLHRRRTGAVVLGLFVFGVALLVVLALTAPRAQLLENLLSSRTLVLAAGSCLAAAAAWMAVIVHAYLIGRPRRMRTGQQVLGVATVVALCLVVAAPLGLAAHLANSQRGLLNTLFPSGNAEAIGKPRLNILLVGSDAGPDRTGTRTDTMMLASLDTRTGRATLFGLPRNIGFARFPPGSPMATRFPDGFHDDADPLSGNYLLNALYAYGHAYPELAPRGPTADPGLNLLQSSISYMLDLPVDYQIVVDMAGFASLIDALGGLRVDVGPERIPIGGIGPHGQSIRPQGYIEPGLQQLSGEQALAFVRSRTGSSDYVRMGRQRCLIQYLLDQKSPTDLLTNFQAVARATTDSVTTNIPRELLPALVELAGRKGSLQLESVAFDPNLPDPNEPDGKFSTYRPNVTYMREVVRQAVDPAADPAPTARPTPSRSPAPAQDPAASTADQSRSSATQGGGASAARGAEPTPEPAAALPRPLAESCTTP